MSGAKERYCACPLHSTPPKGWANYLSHPSCQTPEHTPILLPYKEQACRPRGASEQGNLLLVLTPLLLQQGPHKVLPGFLKKKSGVRQAQKCPPYSVFRKEMEPGALTSGQPGLLELTMPSHKCSPPVPVPMN